MVGACAFLVARFGQVSRLPFWVCLFRQSTGWPCPGCGLTRAFERSARGDLLGALEVNPIGALAAMALYGMAAASLLRLLFRLPVPEPKLSPREARWVRVSLLLALALNYAFVLAHTRFPGLL